MASGSELVRGDRSDRNGPYLAADLLRRGVEPARITIVGDDPADLEAALRAGLEYDLLVVSGGLGPTHDDRTIELLARAAGVGLHVDEELEAAIEELSRVVAARLDRPYADFETGVRKQATLPDGAEWVGLVGTAPAVVLPLGDRVAVALPGPPRELQALWPRVCETAPMQRLLARAVAPRRRVMRLFGVSESSVAKALADAGGDGDGVDVTICAREFELHIDLFVQPGADARADEIERAFEDAVGKYVFSRDERSTAELVRRSAARPRPDARDRRVVHRRARRRRASPTCPGRATSSSARSSRTRTTSSAQQLGVPEEVLATHGAVSAETAAAMATGRASSARRGRRGLRHRRRRPGRRHRGEARRARLPARGRPRAASSPGGSTSRATARRSACEPRWRRCTSCADLSRSRDGHARGRR